MLCVRMLLSSRTQTSICLDIKRRFHLLGLSAKSVLFKIEAIKDSYYLFTWIMIIIIILMRTHSTFIFSVWVVLKLKGPFVQFAIVNQHKFYPGFEVVEKKCFCLYFLYYWFYFTNNVHKVSRHHLKWYIYIML